MADIQSSVDKILEKNNASVTSSITKKLNFDRLNETFDESPIEPSLKRRRYSGSDENVDDTLPTCSNNITPNTTNTSTFDPFSPWQERRLKRDLLEANTRILKLKQDKDRLQKSHQESEILLQTQCKELQKQCDFSTKKVEDLETQMKIVRGKESRTKQELLKTERQLQEQKNISEETIMKLQKEKQSIEQNARIMQEDLCNQLNKYKRNAEKMAMELETNNDELTALKQQLEEYKTRAAAYDKLKFAYENLEQDLVVATFQVKEFQYEISSYKDWKEITKNSQHRLLDISNMDKELEHLRDENKRLHKLLGNTLLLEEKVHNLQTRVDNDDKARPELCALQVQLKYAQDELKEWLKVAEDHCPSKSLVSPLSLRARIEELLQNDIVMTNEKTSKIAENKVIESELLNYKHKCEMLTKNLEELDTALKRYKVVKERIQKKLLLVSRERDCYKELLDNFERDLSIANTTIPEKSNAESQLKCHIEMLEKTLMNYKEFCGDMEKELSIVKAGNVSDQNAICNINIDSTIGYNHLKKELDTLRLENDRLRRRKEELELELEHYYLKGDYDYNKFKVIHLKQNPAAEAYKQSENEIEKLQAEIKRLKSKKTDDDDSDEDEFDEDERDEDTGITMSIKEVNQLKREVQSLNSKIRTMKECYKALNMELREVIYMLFGYRIDHFDSQENYKILSMYAESPDQYLHFRLDNSNILHMLETPYSITLQPLVETHLEGSKSLPVFLSALTLDLFQRTHTMTS